MSVPNPVRLLVSVLVMLLIATTGCGIATDSAPSELAESQIPASLVGGTLPTPAPDDVIEGEGVPIFLIQPDNRRLIEVPRAIEATPEDVLRALLEGPTFNEIRQGLQTAMTRSTAIVDLDFNELFQRVTVTLGPNSLNPDSREQLLAFGQFVFTLTAIDGVESVVFEAVDEEGNRQAIPVQTDLGVSDRGVEVRRADYASIDPGFNIIAFPTDAENPTPTPTTPPNAGGSLLTLPIWVLNADGNLTQVNREVTRSSAALLQTLFDGLITDEVQSGLRTAIPVDALARSVEIVEGELDDGETIGLAVVDLTADSLPPPDAGDERALAVAQIVFTLTGLVEIDQVVFTVDGEPTPMPTQFGVSAPFDADAPAGLRRADYAAYAPGVLVIDRTYDIAPTPAPPADPDALTPTPEVTPTPTPGG